MKPLLGQAQSQLNLDDIFSSSKAVAGNFSRPRADETSPANSSSSKPNFSEFLLRNLADKATKPSADVRGTSDARPPKLPMEKSKDITRREDLDGLERHQRSQTNDTSMRQQYKSPKREAIDHKVDSRDAGTTGSRYAQPASPSRSAADTQVRKGRSPQKVDPALAPLKKQMDGKLTTDNVINNNAILAFITGRLDKLEPDTLPSLLADSQLIKQVLGSGDVANFMESPQSINDLANLLELDQGLLSKAARDGLNPSDLVKPKEFIKALGIDPGQVASELTILQQKLPAEGVSAYIDRARSLAALKNKSELTPNAADLPATKTDQQNIDQAKLPLEPTVPSQTNEESIKNIDGSLASMLASGSLSQAASFAGTNSLSTHSIRSKSAADVQSSSIDNVNTLLDSTTTSSKNSSQLDPSLGNASRSGINPIADLLAGDPAISQSDLQLSVSQADPFAVSLSEIDKSSSTRIEFGGNGIHSRSLEEILLDRNMNLSIQTNRIQDNSSDTNIVTDHVSDIDQLTSSQVKFGEAVDASALATDASVGVTLTNTESNSRDSDGSFSEGGRDHLSDIATSMDSKASSAKDSSVSFSSKLTSQAVNQPKETLAQRILGQADIMFKNGGGSMRMDVEAPGIGKVDVAINLNNNQLDVRIITASDQARDIITREVAGLRDGLSQQGLNLRGLEVGKAGESSSRNFAGQGGQHFGHGAQDQRATYNDMKAYVQSFRNSYNPRASDRILSSSALAGKWNNVAARPLSGSRLEVRV